MAHIQGEKKTEQNVIKLNVMLTRLEMNALLVGNTEKLNLNVINKIMCWMKKHYRMPIAVDTVAFRTEIILNVERIGGNALS